MSCRPFADLFTIPDLDVHIADQLARTYLAVFLFYVQFLGDKENDNPLHFLEEDLRHGVDMPWPKTWHNLASAVDVLCNSARINQKPESAGSFQAAMNICLKGAVEQSSESACAFNRDTGWLICNDGLDAMLLKIAKEISPSEESWEQWLKFVCFSTAAYDETRLELRKQRAPFETDMTWVRDHILLLFVSAYRDLLIKLTGDPDILHRHERAESTKYNTKGMTGFTYYEFYIASWWIVEHEPEGINKLIIPIVPACGYYTDYVNYYSYLNDRCCAPSDTANNIYYHYYSQRQQKTEVDNIEDWILNKSLEWYSLEDKSLRFEIVLDALSGYDLTDFEPCYALKLYAVGMDPSWEPSQDEADLVLKVLEGYVDAILEYDIREFSSSMYGSPDGGPNMDDLADTVELINSRIAMNCASSHLSEKLASLVRAFQELTNEGHD